MNADWKRAGLSVFIGVDRRLNMLLYYCALLSSQVATILPRPKSEGRKSIAQCASTGNRAQDASAPGRGVRIRAQVHLSPRSGAGQLPTWTQGCAPWATIFRPTGSVRSMLFAACRFVLLGIHFFVRRDEFLSSRLVEEGDAGAVHGEDGSDGESTMGSDLVAIGFGDLLDQSVRAEDSQLPADRRGAPELFFPRERGIGMDWPVQQGLEVSVPESPDEELSSIDGLQ